MLILGLGRATKNLVKYLLGKEVEIYAYEEKTIEAIDPEIGELIKKNRIKPLTDLEEFDQVITSPGISEEKEIIKKIRQKGLPMIDEIEFTYRYISKNIIAVTGTNGKSTTTALIAHILNTAGKHCFLGGNLAPGKPFSAALLEPSYQYYALEVSTFQLERIETFRPWIAVLTNITADHLNRHKTIEEYTRLKFRIFENQQTDDFAVLNYDDERIRQKLEGIKSKVFFFSSSQPIDGTYYQDGKIISQGSSILTEHEIRLPGLHNIENIMAAISVVKILGLDAKTIRQTVASFTGLPHRLEFVEKINGVVYINNSMCTNPTAAIAALNAISGEKIVILGGQEKDLSSTEYLDSVIKKARVSIIIGENQERLAAYFKSKGYSSYIVAKDIFQAVAQAKKIAQPGETVVLNPGFASFGDFRDFEERGETFKDAVRKA